MLLKIEVAIRSILEVGMMNMMRRSQILIRHLMKILPIREAQSTRLSNFNQETLCNLCSPKNQSLQRNNEKMRLVPQVVLTVNQFFGTNFWWTNKYSSSRFNKLSNSSKYKIIRIINLHILAKYQDWLVLVLQIKANSAHNKFNKSNN